MAAVIRREGRFLLALRPASVRHGGLWEFPGGKLIEGEDEESALARELQEELGVRLLEASSRLYSTRDPGSMFEIHFWSVEVEGRPEPLEHDELRWVTRAEARILSLAPSDRRFLESMWKDSSASEGLEG